MTKATVGSQVHSAGDPNNQLKLLSTTSATSQEDPVVSHQLSVLQPIPPPQLPSAPQDQKEGSNPKAQTLPFTLHPLAPSSAGINNNLLTISGPVQEQYEKSNSSDTLVSSATAAGSSGRKELFERSGTSHEMEGILAGSAEAGGSAGGPSSVHIKSSLREKAGENLHRRWRASIKSSPPPNMGMSGLENPNHPAHHSSGGHPLHSGASDFRGGSHPAINADPGGFYPSPYSHHDLIAVAASAAAASSNAQPPPSELNTSWMSSGTPPTSLITSSAASNADYLYSSAAVAAAAAAQTSPSGGVSSYLYSGGVPVSTAAGAPASLYDNPDVAHETQDWFSSGFSGLSHQHAHPGGPSASSSSTANLSTVAAVAAAGLMQISPPLSSSVGPQTTVSSAEVFQPHTHSATTAAASGLPLPPPLSPAPANYYQSILATSAGGPAR